MLGPVPVTPRKHYVLGPACRAVTPARLSAPPLLISALGGSDDALLGGVLEV